MKRNTNLLLLLLFIFCNSLIAQQWIPDAGYVEPLSENATATASSSINAPENVIDNDLATSWQSTNPLPRKYLSRSDENVFIEDQDFMLISDGITDFDVVRDGDPDNGFVTISSSNGSAELEVHFAPDQHLVYYSIKTNAPADIVIYGITATGEVSYLETHTPMQNWGVIGYKLDSRAYTKLRLSSTQSFQLYEIGGLIVPPAEHVTLDLTQSYIISDIKTKVGTKTNTAVNTRLYISEDATSWTEVAALDPSNYATVQTFLPAGTMARYVRVEHRVNLSTQSGVSVFEIQVNPVHGEFGPPLPTDVISTHKLGDIIGINTVWGWGQGISSDNLPNGQGPLLHNSYASHARNYHFMSWDIPDPDSPVDFSQMGTGCPSPTCEDCVLLDCWLDWDKEYQAWVDAGLKVQTTLQFDLYLNLRIWWEDQWNDPYQSAYNYGRAFALHFGPTHGNGLVETIEIGNEPWYYDAAIYREILSGMARGAKSADSAIEVFPCALQAYDPHVEIPSEDLQFRNYIGARIPESAIGDLDGINIHNYSFIRSPTGERIAVHPEHPGSEFNGIRSAVRFRDANMPGKKILLSEWGWDSPSVNEDCVHSECVSEEAAVAYVPRGAMIAHRSNLDGATYFFYANQEKQYDDNGQEIPSSLFTRSGLTESMDNSYKPKKTFVAMNTLVAILGDYHFIEAYREDEGAYIYKYGDADGNVTHIAAWLPIDGDSQETATVSYASTAAPGYTVEINGDAPGGQCIPVPDYDGSTISLVIGVKPIIVELAPCPPQGTPCDDGNPNTVNDQHDGYCNCVGTCMDAGTSCDDENPNTICDVYDENCVCMGTPAGEGCEFIVNGNFDNNIDGWYGNACTPVFDNRSMSITNITAGNVAWDAFVYQGGFSLLEGEEYIVSFKASAATDRTLGFKLGLSVPPSNYYYGEQNISLTTSMQEYSYTFTMADTSSSQVNLEFHVADSDAVIMIDDISVRAVNCLDIMPDECEHIPNGTFDFDLKHWNAVGCSSNYNNGEAAITNITAGSNDVSASRFFTKPISVNNGREYELSFYASASANRTAFVRFGSSTVTHHEQMINLTSLTQHYTFTFTVNDPDALEAVLQFNLGGNTANVYLDDVSLMASDCPPPSSSCNLLENDMFNMNVLGWDYWGCIPSWHNGVMEVSNINPDAAPQNAIVYQASFTLNQEQVYEVRFKAAAASNRTIGIQLRSIAYPYTVFFYEQVNLNSTMQDYTYTFTMADMTNPQVRLEFHLGGDATTVTFDNIVAAPVDCPTLPPSCNIIKNGNFTNNLNDWASWMCTAMASNQRVWVSDITTGQDSWDAGLGQYPLPLAANVNYELTFDAWAAAPRPLVVSIDPNIESWSTFLFQQVNLKTDLASFTLNFTAPASTDFADLDFFFGDSAHEVWLDNIVLKEVGCVDACIANIEVLGVTQSGTYRAGTGVTSGAIIPPHLDINFRAGEHILMKAGFEVKKGAEFSADIEPCEH